MIDGSDIKNARERAGLSQQALADRLGVALRTVGNWERGKTDPRGSEARIRDVLGPHLRESDDAPDPAAYGDIDARLANLDRQVDALWRRVEQLEQRDQRDGGGDAGGSVTPLRPRTPPQAATGPEPGLALPADQTPGEPSQYEEVTRDQDRAGEENQDPDDGDGHSS